MSEIIGRINREKGFEYRVDKDGNVTKEKYSWFKDRTTLIMLVIFILGGLYYMEMKQSVTNADNFDKYCTMYMNLRQDFVLNNPDKEVNIRNVVEYYELNKEDLDFKFNLSNG